MGPQPHGLRHGVVTEEENDLARGGLHAYVSRQSRACVLLVDHRKSEIGSVVIEPPAGSIARTVIHDHDLARRGKSRNLIEDRPDHPLKIVQPVIGRNNDARRREMTIRFVHSVSIQDRINRGMARESRARNS